MPRSVKALLAVVALATIAAAGVIMFTLPHWWLRVGTAVARDSIGSVHQVFVYKSTRAELMFVIQENSYLDKYIYYPTTGEIGMPSGDVIHFVAFLAFSNEVPVSVVLSSDKVKVETDMNINVEGSRLQFTTLGKSGRVEADLSNY